jgi:hypothetical protein
MRLPLQERLTLIESIITGLGHREQELKDMIHDIALALKQSAYHSGN